MSYIYLICFGQPIGNPSSKHGQACHYLGFTSKSLKKRLEQHRSGTAAKVTRAASLQYGRELTITRHWSNGTRALERELKRRHCPRHYCPRCNNRAPNDTPQLQESGRPTSINKESQNVN